MAQEIRTDEEVVDSPRVRELKRIAKRYAKQSRVSHSFALDYLAKKEGFNNWALFRRASNLNLNPGLPRKGPEVQAREPIHSVNRYAAGRSLDEERLTNPPPRKIPVTYKKRRPYTVDLRSVPDEVPPFQLREDFGDEERQMDIDMGDSMPFHGSQD